MESLDAFVGEWSLTAAAFPGPPGRTTFEWMSGGRFLVQRWEAGTLPVDGKEIDFTGINIYGPDSARDGYLQHYFDSRGVARVYQMSFENGVWKLWRDTEDFSPLDFSQRFTGTFSEDGKTIEGRWEINHDGKTWETDFEITYTKVG